MTTLYHYCSNTAFLSIISSREVFASEFTLSNDILEGKWIREVVRQYILEKPLHSIQQSLLLNQID
jgi:hypothetical protein